MDVSEAEAGAEKPRKKRRSRLAGGVRSTVVGVRVTPDEKSELQARAEARGTTVQGLMLAASLTHEVGGADQLRERGALAAELMRVQRLVGNVADNMNQVARHANTVHEVPSDFRAALTEARAVWDRCDEVLEQLVVLNRRAGA